MAGTKNNKKSMAVWEQEPLEPLECIDTTTAGVQRPPQRHMPR
jgi:hypothetical protein